MSLSSSMMRTILLLSLLFVSFALAEPDCKDDVCTNNIGTNSTAARGVIVSVRGCKLKKKMPQVRTFIMESVLKGEYGDVLKVNFTQRGSPKLVLFDAEDKEISRTPLSRLKYKELHALVQSHGFVRTPRTPEQILADREELRRKKSKFMLKPRVPPAPAAAAVVSVTAAGGVSEGAESGTSVE